MTSSDVPTPWFDELIIETVCPDAGAVDALEYDCTECAIALAARHNRAITQKFEEKCGEYAAQQTLMSGEQYITMARARVKRVLQRALYTHHTVTVTRGHKYNACNEHSVSS